MLKFLYRMLENPRVYELSQRLLGEGRVSRAISEVMTCQLRNISYSSVLDVGCGTGLFRYLFDADYTGVDINADYIEKARSSIRGSFFTADAVNLPFEPESYDLVFTLGVLHHLGARERGMMCQEMWRVCRAGGHILIIDGLIPSNEFNLLGFALAKLDRGGFKMRFGEFRSMLDSALQRATWENVTPIKVFPYELCAVTLRKHQV